MLTADHAIGRLCALLGTIRRPKEIEDLALVGVGVPWSDLLTDGVYIVLSDGRMALALKIDDSKVVPPVNASNALHYRRLLSSPGTRGRFLFDPAELLAWCASSLASFDPCESCGSREWPGTVRRNAGRLLRSLPPINRELVRLAFAAIPVLGNRAELHLETLESDPFLFVGEDWRLAVAPMRELGDELSIFQGLHSLVTP